LSRRGRESRRFLSPDVKGLARALFERHNPFPSSRPGPSRELSESGSQRANRRPCWRCCSGGLNAARGNAEPQSPSSVSARYCGAPRSRSARTFPLDLNFLPQQPDCVPPRGVFDIHQFGAMPLADRVDAEENMLLGHLCAISCNRPGIQRPASTLHGRVRERISCRRRLRSDTRTGMAVETVWSGR